LAILGALIFILISYFMGDRLLNRGPSLSPYTKMPLRNARDLSYENQEKLLRYLYSFHQYDNQMFNLQNAALCRETGRVFPDALDFFGTIKVDWTFLDKRYPGKYVSWGSLSDYQKETIINAHHTFEGYQTEYSSLEPAPSKVDSFYAMLSPGPLYVDLETKVLLGWKIVPNSTLEVLIVQKPKGILELPKSLQ
jgi:hypothetical protein